VIASLKRGVRFSVLERETGRLRVKLSDGRIGWVDAGNVRVGDDRKPLPAADSWSMRNSLTRTAVSYRGARYVRGGTTASGFDCSGFVKFLFEKHGVKLPHSSSAQFSCGKSVSKSDLQPGDVVFFGGTYRHGISHVGLYLGGGKFIHASTERAGVRVDDLNSAYYRRKYAGARRIR
jgi:cell wall-associated NlpC family hydrolase